MWEETAGHENYFLGSGAICTKYPKKNSELRILQISVRFLYNFFLSFIFKKLLKC